jgi:hypothetical protein
MRSKAVIVATAMVVLLVAGGLAAQALPPPPQTALEYASSVMAPVAVPADGQVGSWTHNCSDSPVNGIVLDASAVFSVSDSPFPPQPADVRPEFSIASTLELNNPPNVTFYWRNNPPGGEAGTIFFVVHCAIYR